MKMKGCRRCLRIWHDWTWFSYNRKTTNIGIFCSWIIFFYCKSTENRFSKSRISIFFLVFGVFAIFHEYMPTWHRLPNPPTPIQGQTASLNRKSADSRFRRRPTEGGSIAVRRTASTMRIARVSSVFPLDQSRRLFNCCRCRAVAHRW